MWTAVLLTTKHVWGSYLSGSHLLPSRAWKFPWRSCSGIVDVSRIVSEVIWASCLAGVLCNQSKCKLRVTTVWPISFYSGKDLCKGCCTPRAVHCIAIDGCHKELILHHPLKPCHSCNSGDKGNCQNNKSLFAASLRMNSIQLTVIYYVQGKRYFAVCPDCELHHVESWRQLPFNWKVISLMA